MLTLQLMFCVFLAQLYNSTYYKWDLNMIYERKT